jgi:hypothetical protein
MWSYYAAAHQGIVFGLEIANPQADIVSISKVTYSRDNIFRGFLGSDAETEARKILSKKLSPWRHEKEVRVFSKSSFVQVVLRRAYFGCLMPEEKKSLLRQVIKRLNPSIEIIELKRDDLDRNLGTNVI